MNATLDYTFRYGNPPPAPTPSIDRTAPLYASEDAVVASLSNSECVFQVKRSGETHVMTFQVLQALDQSREFRTLDEHASRILATVRGIDGQREAVLRVLGQLVSRGLLVSDADFLRRVATAPATAPAPLRAAVIRACDRPDQLAELLRSLGDYERRFHAGRHYVVVDDSTLSASVDRHRDSLREFARGTGCKVTYLGATERSRLVQGLARAVPQAAGILPYLLGGEARPNRFGGGRGWNIALLLSAGARLCLFDDDQRLPLRRPEGALTGLDPDPVSPAGVVFHRNLENALGAGEDVEIDPFELHLGVAGHRLGELVARSEYAIDREALRGLALSRLDHLEGSARIVATHQGTYGSARTESGAWLYQLSAAERAEFAVDRERYLRNIEAGSLWHGRRQAKAVLLATFTPFAFDNSRMLPCTNPIGRGEDALFGRVTEACHPDSLILDLPVAIGHAQETQRKRSARTLAAHTPRFNYFIGEFIQRQLPQFHAESPADRLRLLGAHVRDLGSASDAGVAANLREYLAFSRADLIERLQNQFESASDAPVWWQADVRSIIEANGRALVAKNAPRLGDWPDDIDVAGCVAALREETHALANAFEHWPALWEHAREQGERLLASI